MAGIRRKTLFLCLLVGAGCGGNPDARLTPRRSSNVLKATTDQLLQGLALPNSYIVTFRSLPGGPGLRFANFAAEYQAHFNYLATEFLPDPRVKDIRFLTSIDFHAAAPELTAGQAMPSYLTQLSQSTLYGDQAVGSMAQVDFAGAAEAESALAAWDDSGAIWFAEPNFVSHLSALPADAPTDDFKKYADFKSFATNYSQLNYWWLSKINLAQAYAAIANRDLTQPDTPSDDQLTANRPIVAVLDSGVDYAHPALSDRIWHNTDQNAANCANDLYGCNTTAARRGSLGNGDVWPFDVDGPDQSCIGHDENCSHGTHVAGLIAADSNWKEPTTGRATAGVCPICQIMILKIVSKVGKESGILDSSIIAAFKYVTLFRREGSPAVRVINASFGKFVRSRSVGLMIRLMKEKNGALLVAAAGNEDTLTQEFPAAFSDAIAVAAVDEQLKKVSFSNFGRWVSIAAPGQQMTSTVPGRAAEDKSGTSMATPMVAGVAGLLLARFPKISFDDLRSSIIQGADPTIYGRDFADGFNYNYYYPKIPQEQIRQPLLGFGMLNAKAAIDRTPSQNLPIFSSLDRVKPGCAAVLGGAGSELSMLLLLLVGLLPTVLNGLLARPRRIKNH